MITLNILIISIIQGITEFLPISSSAHLILFPALTGEADQGLMIDVSVHVGTLVAVLIYFHRDTVTFTRGLIHLLSGRTKTPEARLMTLLIIATIPVVIVGAVVSLAGWSDALRSVKLIAWTTVVYGVILWLADRYGPRVKVGEEWSLRDAIVMGLAQALAILPGTSRSGITITLARALGYKRVEAARLSMVMSVPTIIAAGTLVALEIAKTGSLSLTMDALAAAALSMVSALIALVFMMRWLARWTLTPFVVYRMVLGAALFVYVYA